MDWFVYKHHSKHKLRTGRVHIVKNHFEGDKWVKEAFCGRKVHFMMGRDEYIINPYWTEHMKPNDAGVCKDCQSKYRGKLRPK